MRCKSACPSNACWENKIIMAVINPITASFYFYRISYFHTQLCRERPWPFRQRRFMTAGGYSVNVRCKITDRYIIAGWRRGWCSAQRIINIDDCRWQSYIDSMPTPYNRIYRRGEHCSSAKNSAFCILNSALKKPSLATRFLSLFICKSRGVEEIQLLIGNAHIHFRHHSHFAIQLDRGRLIAGDLHRLGLKMAHQVG